MTKLPLKKVALTAMLLMACQLSGKELEPSIRAAERLYQSGRYEEAAQKALEIHRFFPGDLQTLLILGMSDFHAGNYLQAVDWFRLAHKLSPKHPIVVRYTELLRELEYRSGPFSRDPDRQNMADGKTSAEFFKRGFFGPNFNVTSINESPGAGSSPLDPVLMRAAPASSTMITNPDLPSKLALPTPYPPLDSILSAEIMSAMAAQALNNQEFHKAWLFYSQLAESAPQNRRYLIGKAEAAFHMKRYRQVLEILGPVVAAGTAGSFSEEQQKKVQLLMEQSRKLVFSGRSH